MQRARAFRLDANDFHAPPVPCRDAGDQAAAPDGDQHRVEIGCIFLPLEPDAALTGDGLGRVVGVDRKRTARRNKCVAGIERIRVARAADAHVRAIAFDARDLHRRGHIGHEDRRPVAEPLRRVGDGCAVVAARRRRHPARRHGARQQVLNAPRGLNVPVCCRNSSLNVSGWRSVSPKSSAAARSTDVRRTCDLMRAEAARISSCVGIMPISVTPRWRSASHVRRVPVDREAHRSAVRDPQRRPDGGARIDEIVGTDLQRLRGRSLNGVFRKPLSAQQAAPQLQPGRMRLVLYLLGLG